MSLLVATIHYWIRRDQQYRAPQREKRDGDSQQELPEGPPHNEHSNPEAGEDAEKRQLRDTEARSQADSMPGLRNEVTENSTDELKETTGLSQDDSDDAGSIVISRASTRRKRTRFMLPEDNPTAKEIKLDDACQPTEKKIENTKNSCDKQNTNIEGRSGDGFTNVINHSKDVASVPGGTDEAMENETQVFHEDGFGIGEPAEQVFQQMISREKPSQVEELNPQSSHCEGPNPQSSHSEGPNPQSSHIEGPNPQSSHIEGPNPQSSYSDGPNLFPSSDELPNPIDADFSKNGCRKTEGSAHVLVSTHMLSMHEFIEYPDALNYMVRIDCILFPY